MRLALNDVAAEGPQAGIGGMLSRLGFDAHQGGDHAGAAAFGGGDGRGGPATHCGHVGHNAQPRAFGLLCQARADADCGGHGRGHWT